MTDDLSAPNDAQWGAKGPVNQHGRSMHPFPEWVGATGPSGPSGPTSPSGPTAPVEPPPVWAGAADPLPKPVLPIDRYTVFRGHLDCGEAVWLAEHTRIGSPIPVDQQKTCYAAVKPWSAQALATGVKETELGKTATGNNNLFNLFVPDGSGPKDFTSWEAGAKEWYARYADPNYKGGVYMPRDITSEQAIVTYQGGPGCWTSKGQTCAHGETWKPCQGGSATSNSIELSVQQFVARVNTFMGHPQATPWSPLAGAAGCAEGTTPPPDGTTPAIYTLPQDAARYGISQSCAQSIVNNRFENRSGRPILGIVLHTQEGTTPGSLGWWCSQGIQASSTVMIQKDGSVLNIVPEKHGPWTNGDSCNSTAKGIDFTNRCGNNPNTCSLTIETEGYYGETHPQKQIDALVWQCRQWMSTYGLACKDILAHRDINRCSRANCSGADIYNRVMQGLGCPERY